MTYKLSGEVRPNSHVCVSISLGQEMQTKEFLCEKLDSICSNTKIDKVTFLLADTLQRHHIQFLKNLSENEAYIEAKEAGNQWIEENKELIQKLQQSGKSIVIKRWDDYRLAESFNVKLEQLYELLESTHFDRGISSLVDIFTNKIIEDKKIKNNKGAIRGAMRIFALEECAVRLVAGDDDEANYGYEIYAGGKLNNSLKDAYKKLGNRERMRILEFVIEHRQQPKKISTSDRTLTIFFNISQTLDDLHSDSREDL